MIPRKVRRFVQETFPKGEISWGSGSIDGFKNNTFFFAVGKKKYVVKSSVVNDRGSEKLTEFSLLRLLKEGPVPRPIAVSRRRNMLVRSFIEGERKTTLSDSEVRVAAKELANLHRIRIRKAGLPFKRAPVKDFREYFGKEIGFVREGIERLSGAGRSPKLRDHLNRLLESALVSEKDKLRRFKGTGFTVVNFDLLPKNIVWKNNRPFVVDWGDAVIADPAIELSRVLLNWGFNRRQYQIFSKAYHSNDPDVWYRSRTYVRFMEINRLAWEAKMFHDLATDRIKPAGERNKGYFEESFTQHYIQYMKRYEGRVVSGQRARGVLHG